MGSRIELDLRDADDGINTVVVVGELDFATASVLAERLSRAADRGSGLLVDLSGCTFIDSTGISMLLNACRRQTRSREGMAVICPNPTPLRVFEITGTVDTLQVVPSRAAAEAAIARMQRGVRPRRRTEGSTGTRRPALD